ncbi:MAG: site-specific integrase [Planctomycetes bacterium]|nr:site-specific integrase [Planctomycetota bacterium]
MAHLVRQSFTCYVDANGKRVPKGTKKAKKVTEKSAKWYGCALPNQGKKRFPLATDKAVAQRMLADLVEKFERGTANMAVREETSLALSSLISEFQEAVRRKSSEKHTLDVIGHVKKVMAGCKLKSLGDLRSPGLVPKVEAFVWSLMKGDEPITSTTAAYTGKHARGFTRWLWKKRKLLDNDPLAGMDLPSQQTDNPRRDLSVDELERVLAAAEASTETIRSLAGPDRALIYLLGAATGYRAGELARLTPADFDLDADVPVVRLKGKQTKNKKPAEQPLPPGLRARLRSYLAGRLAGDRVWPGLWYRRAADILRVDLATAGVPEMASTGEAVFHSLRHSYSSFLARSASVKVTQELLRHASPNLTIARYSHSTLAERAEAVAALPLPGEGITAGPFAGMPRAELETTAEQLLITVQAITATVAALLTPVLTPLLTPDSGILGNDGGRVDTTTHPGRRVG